MEDGAETAELSKNKVYTDSEGQASVDLEVLQNAPAEFTLRVSVDGNDQVVPITYNVVVSSKLGAPLIITFVENYDPVTTQFASIETTLYRQSDEEPFLCDQLDLTEKLPSGGIGLPPVDESIDTIEVPSLPNLEADGEGLHCCGHSNYLARGIGSVGCNDVDGHVEVGSSAVVPITLSPVPPDYTGVCEITTNLDLLSFLPDEVEQILDAIFALFESPTGGIALLAPLGTMWALWMTLGFTLQTLKTRKSTNGEPSGPT